MPWVRLEGFTGAWNSRYRPTGMTNLTLVVLKIFVETNLVPGFWGGVDPNDYKKTNSQGMIEPFSIPALGVLYVPKLQVVTNYVIGVRLPDGQPFELLTATKAGPVLPFNP